MKPIIFKNPFKKPLQRLWPCIMCVYVCLIVLLNFNSAVAQTTEAYNWGNVAIGGGGFVSGIVTSRTKGGPIYARTDVGGAYRWDSRNSKWLPLTDFANENQQGIFGTLALAIDPQRQNVVYILAGISYFNNGTSYILRSTDSGATFSITDVTAKFKVNGNALGRQNGERLQVDPYDSTVVYCGTQANGLFKSTDKGSTWNATNLPVTNTTNGNGVSFIVMDKPNGKTGTQTKTLFAGISRTGSNQNFYRSDNAGSTFSAINNTGLAAGLMPQRAALTNDGAYLYITYGNGAGPNGNTNITPTEPYDQGQIWRYAVAGGTWANVTPTGMNKPFGGISIDPLNNSRLVASTTNVYYTQGTAGAYGDRFYYSTNSGGSWTDLVAQGFSINSNGVPWLANASIHWAGCIEFDPSSANRVMVTSGNGTFVNNDITNTAGVWNVNVKGIEETVPRNMVSITGGGPVVSVISDYDGFTQSDPTQYAAQRHTPTMGSTTALDYSATATNKKVVRAASSMYYSTDQGYTWTKTTGNLTVNDGQVALSADGNTYLYCAAGSGTINRSTNNGTNWATSTITGVTTTDLRPVADGATSAKFYVYNPGTNPGLYVSTNGGANWAKSSGTLAGGGSKIIRTVPTFDGDVWVALAGGGLVYTQDSGVTFTTVTNVTSCSAVGIGKAPACVPYPAIYIWGSVSGSANGLYRSFDKGANWTRVNDDDHQYGGLANGQFVVGDMNTVGNVYMSTAGRGIAFGAKIPAMDVSPATLTFSSAMGSQNVSVVSTDYWNVTSNQSWITRSPANGCPSTAANPATVTITVAQNTGTTSRTGTVSIYAGGVTRTIEINQNYNCTPTNITPYVKVNANAWVQTAAVSLAAGGSLSLGPQPNTTTGWDWTGPNGFTSTLREIDFTNIQPAQAGTYVATYTNAGGCKDSQTFTVTVTGGTGGNSTGGSTGFTDVIAQVVKSDIAVVPPTDNLKNVMVAYPNPVDDNVTITVNTELVGGKLTITNTFGNLLYTDNIKQANKVINLSKLPAGIFIINVVNGKNNASVKIIKK